MRVYVKGLTGVSRFYELSPDSSILDLKKKVHVDEFVPLDQQRLLFHSKDMLDWATLDSYGITDHCTVHLLMRLLGGGKKRKKKTYTTPKKHKHKRKKVKLAVLKYYKVDENGTISRLRKECPSATCGGGVFMASHQNRYYCGKCYHTLVVAERDKGVAVKK